MNGLTKNEVGQNYVEYFDTDEAIINQISEWEAKEAATKQISDADSERALFKQIEQISGWEAKNAFTKCVYMQKAEEALINQIKQISMLDNKEALFKQTIKNYDNISDDMAEIQSNYLLDITRIKPEPVFDMEEWLTSVEDLNDQAGELKLNN